MDSSPARGALRSPVTFAADAHPRDAPANRRRKSSLSSDSSDSSQITALSVKRPPQQPEVRNPNGSTTTNLQNASRPSGGALARALNEHPSRTHSPATDSSTSSRIGHRARQHSQGFFEPSLPGASQSNSSTMSNNLTASQIAAQAAMQAQNPQHLRRRSQTIPDPGAHPTARRQQSSPPPVPPINSSFAVKQNSQQGQDGFIGGLRLTAATAANAAFPRSPLYSPGLPPEHAPSPAPEKEVKSKEKSKMKLFSKPKSIGISKERDKDADRKNPAMPSPNKMAMHSTSALPSRLAMNASTPSLVDSTVSGASSFYSSANASTSTLVPTERTTTFVDGQQKEKEKHKHHFLSRQKNKLQGASDHHNLPLSSASSNSKPTDPYAPQPLYSFAAPASPGHSSTFAQSVSGLDLRHGGRALRQKKKEEKAAAAQSQYASSINEILEPSSAKQRNESFSNADRSDWPGPASLGAVGLSMGTTGTNSPYTYLPDPSLTQASVANLGAAFGLPGIGPDDAWPLLKARLLNIFEGEDPRPPIEDFNALVSVHMRRCIQRRTPVVLIEDLSELLQTGFSSLDQTLRHIPDERLVPSLVEMWIVVFCTILPFMQAVFLPLDLEFKGRGPIMSPREAAEFWGAALPDSELARSSESTTGTGGKKTIPTLGEELDVRRITLLTFRDTVILPRHEALMAIFSRLSLEAISAGTPGDSTDAPTARPATATDPSDPSSLPSQSALSTSSSSNPSTSQSSSSAGASILAASRSRATSNTSAGSFNSIPRSTVAPSSTSALSSHPLPPAARPRPMDGAQVTETVGRMLQCVSVLASVQSGDEAQRMMERLTSELKYNWLGRGRTGRQRRGFVGRRAGGVGGPGAGTGVGLGLGARGLAGVA
ncbi:hypothetical protein W97_07004 [Coniosporium apollinis CBS 100218]|uniref:HbrB-like protein n=1 Tax=Coniosporium apollinis (strain CBS 100218) TaxID=1168221 RepID=R7Z0L6_CONA1|nr:uncharacterized protein W97_07004 [Coniosporium apollinis CBS 100218]EON67750.1 hypothetical protein W97_07004 [Coniosporium apollinis CBS 100218]